MAEKTKFDAVVVGSGPNGLAAGIAMQKAGVSVLILEGKETIGGGMRSAELTLPGFTHDICSAIHPMAADSPFLKTMPLHKHGLEWIYPPYALAHPFDDGQAAILEKSIDATAETLGVDSMAYKSLMEGFVPHFDKLARDLLGPLKFPRHPLLLARFGLQAIQSGEGLADRKFKGKAARGLFAGLAAHSMLPLNFVATSAIGLVLGMIGHSKGWPIPKGGTQKLADALAAYFIALGGTIKTSHQVNSMGDIPPAKAVLFDVNTHQLLAIAGQEFSSLYKYQLKRFRYGLGAYKIDWALDGPIPFKAEGCSLAGTVHLGGTLPEIAAAEQAVWNGKHPEKPYVLLAQQSLFDKTRAPEGKHTVWGYCHVPSGSTINMTAQIENQIERFAPGFKGRILSKSVINAAAYEAYNPNYFGGDINGGAQDITQIFTRPAIRLSPYATSKRGLYICSSSTPPGGGVHGMCGFHAAKKALKDIFGIKISL